MPWFDLSACLLVHEARDERDGAAEAADDLRATSAELTQNLLRRLQTAYVSLPEQPDLLKQTMDGTVFPVQADAGAAVGGTLSIIQARAPPEHVEQSLFKPSASDFVRLAGRTAGLMHNQAARVLTAREHVGHGHCLQIALASHRNSGEVVNRVDVLRLQPVLVEKPAIVRNVTVGVSNQFPEPFVLKRQNLFAATMRMPPQAMHCVHWIRLES
jgi:hypothetical protein